MVLLDHLAADTGHLLQVVRPLEASVRLPPRDDLLGGTRTDPFELAEHSWQYWQWRADRLFLLVPAQQYVGQFLATFKEFPPSQKVGSFSLDSVLESLTNAQTSGK